MKVLIAPLVLNILFVLISCSHQSKKIEIAKNVKIQTSSITKALKGLPEGFLIFSEENEQDNNEEVKTAAPKIKPKKEILPIKKDIKIAKVNIPSPKKINNRIEKLIKTAANIESTKKSEFEHYGFKVENIDRIDLTAYYENYRLGEKLALIEKNIEKERELLASYDPTNVEQFESVDRNVIADIVKTKQAAAQKEAPQEKAKKEEEIVFFDYSKKEQESTVSQTIKNVIKRENKNIQIASNQKPRENRNYAPSVKKQESDQDALNAAIAKVVSPSNDDGAIPYRAASENAKSEVDSQFVSFRAIDPNLVDKSSPEGLVDYQFIPAYAKMEESIRSERGSLRIPGVSPNSQKSIINGIIVKNGYQRTRVQVKIEKGATDSSQEFPVISQEDMRELLDTQNLDGYGGYVLVELSESITDVTLNDDEVSKIYLDENFQVSSIEKEYLYILFVDVRPGNNLLTYLTTESEYSKITFVAENEVSFDRSEPYNQERSFRFYEQTLLSNKLSPLVLEHNKDVVNFFDKELIGENDALNSVKFPLDKLYFDRDYLELSHLGEKIILGSNKLQNVIPSREFISRTFEELSIDDLNGKCIVQVNMPKSIENIYIEGEDDGGHSLLDIYSLDEDGRFENEFSTMSEKSFVVGYKQGIIDLRLNYIDGTSDFLTTYCSTGTYLIEQL